MSILDKHKVEYGEAPQVLVTVPGVVTLVGEFSDYGQGYALCGTCSKTLSIAVSKRQDSFVKVLNSLSNDKKKFSLSSIKYRKEDRWGNYLKGIIIELQKLVASSVATPSASSSTAVPKVAVSNVAVSKVAVPGMNITLAGDLLCGDGKILSAAIGVGVCLAFSKLTGFELKDELIAKCCYQCSSMFCNELTNCHLVFTILKAQEGKFMLFDMLKHSFTYVNNPFKASKYSILLADGHIPPVAMREELYAKHNQAKAVMQEIAKISDKENLRDFPAKEINDRIIPISDVSRRIAGYVFEESQNAKAMAKYFEEKDFAQIGRALNKVGKGLRDVMEITCPELDWLAKRSTEVPGCIGNSIVYSGCGGFIAVVMEKASISSYINKLDEYERIFGFEVSVEDYEPYGTATVVVDPKA